MSLTYSLFGVDTPFDRPELLVGSLLLAGLLVVGAAVIYAVDRWRKWATSRASDDAKVDDLSRYRQLLDNGDITQAEYAKLRERVAGQVKGGAVATPESPTLPDASPPVPPA